MRATELNIAAAVQRHWQGSNDPENQPPLPMTVTADQAARAWGWIHGRKLTPAYASLHMVCAGLDYAREAEPLSEPDKAPPADLTCCGEKLTVAKDVSQYFDIMATCKDLWPCGDEHDEQVDYSPANALEYRSVRVFCQECGTYYEPPQWIIDHG